MNELVELINKLQDVFAASGSPGVDLPQIVVIGTQSSGKSSVLEHIVGHSFLPRGVGIVTRCPLILQLVHALGEDEEYTFQQDSSRKLTDFNVITKAIEDETNKLAGANKGICRTPISLKLFSPSFLNLTLVDLPGITKVPVGDQPRDIESQTRNLIMEYIKNPNSIILAVSPANADMATSEALKLAKEVDPSGTRTLAVITKLDLMDQGTDAWDMLTGRVIPVKLGIIGVVNRSQKDIQDDKSIYKSLRDEEEFLNSHYKQIASENGCPYLKKKVQSILVSHIKQCMPDLKEKIMEKLWTTKQELEQIKNSRLDKPTLLLDLMTKFSTTYVSAIRGNSTCVGNNGLYGGATVKKAFHETLSNALNKIGALDGLTEPFIKNSMENSSGVNSAIFVPEAAFESLVKTQIQKLRKPALECVGLVCKEMNKIIQLCIDDPDLGLVVYPKLQGEFEKVVSELLQSQMPTTNQMVNHFIDVQIAFINTVHPDFSPNSAQGLEEINNIKKANANLSKSNQDYKLITHLITSYFAIVKKTIKDTIPKLIMHFLVNFVTENLQKEMMKWWHKSDPDTLLLELDGIDEKRKELEGSISALEKANDIINQFSSEAKVRYNL